MRSTRVRIAVWLGVMLAFPWLVLKDGSMLELWFVPHGVNLGVFCACGAAWIAAVALWRPGFQPFFDRAQIFAGNLLLFASLSSVVILCELAWGFWEARGLNHPRPLHRAHLEAARSTKTGPHARIVWIILDELSYRQAYEHRFPGLALPAFDQLAGESTVFTHVLPAAIYTDEAVPSMLTGTPVDRMSASADGTTLWLHDPLTGRWRLVDPERTVFQDALDHGYRTAIAGWHNPYCRLLAEVLDRCDWIFRERNGFGMANEATVAWNTLAPWREPMHLLRLGHRGKDAMDDHIQDYRELLAASDRLLDDATADFVLLHLPVPHPGAVYDRRTQTFTTGGGSYIDNLALADATLAHLRQRLMDRGEWESSAVLVMGDHSWRTAQIWMRSPYWTAEDVAASDGGKFDDRPAYVVKLPYQTEGKRVDGAFAAAGTRALLDGILEGQIRSTDDLDAFVKAYNGKPGDAGRR